MDAKPKVTQYLLLNEWSYVVLINNYIFSLETKIDLKHYLSKYNPLWDGQNKKVIYWTQVNLCYRFLFTAISVWMLKISRKKISKAK